MYLLFIISCIVLGVILLVNSTTKHNPKPTELYLTMLPESSESPKVTIGYDNFWPNMTPNNSGLFLCLQTMYPNLVFVPKEEDPDVMLFSCFGDIKKVKLYGGKKIFFYGENLDRYPPYNDIPLIRDTFDLIIGSRDTSSDLKEVRFPLWITYYGCWDTQSLMDNLNNLYKKNSAIPKKNEATLIASHDLFGQRTIISDEVAKHIPVQYPGKFRNNCKSMGPTVGNKIDFLKKYRYNICPENSVYDNYWTEKIFQAIQAGSIPIYWATGPPEPKILNEQCYCFVDISNPKNVEAKIKHAITNPQSFKVKSIFKPTAKKELDKIFFELKTALDQIILVQSNR